MATLIADLLTKTPYPLTEDTKVVIMIDTFAPLTVTDWKRINHLSHSQPVFLFVSNSSKTLIDYTRMTHEARYQAVREAFIDSKNIFVTKLNTSTDLNTALIMNFISNHTTGVLNSYLHHLVYLTPDSDVYSTLQKPLQSELTHTHIFSITEDENTLRSQINRDPFGMWEYIHPTFKRFYRKVVSIVGASSGGKSTLAKHLAGVFNGKANSEYIRHYNNHNHRYINESNYSARDYLSIISGQLAWSEQLLNTTEDVKVVFLDTCPVVTDSYVQLSKSNFSETDYQTLLGMTSIAKQWSKNNVDLFLEVPYDTEFVSDGFRDGHYAETRKVIHDIIHFSLTSLDRLGAYKYLDGDSFEQNDRIAEHIVEDILKPINFRLQPLCKVNLPKDCIA